MAVDDPMKVDGICKGSKADELVLLIADHLDWTAEKEHLEALQSKINAYATFIDSKQYSSVYSGEQFASFIIQIMFLTSPSERARKFLDAAADYLKRFNIKIIAETV